MRIGSVIKVQEMSLTLFPRLHNSYVQKWRCNRDYRRGQSVFTGMWLTPVNSVHMRACFPFSNFTQEIVCAWLIYFFYRGGNTQDGSPVHYRADTWRQTTIHAQIYLKVTRVCQFPWRKPHRHMTNMQPTQKEPNRLDVVQTQNLLAVRRQCLTAVPPCQPALQSS